MKINITTRKDFVIVEKCNENTLFKGSHLYCGLCGESMGVLTEDIQFPFDSRKLTKVVADKTYITIDKGLLHSKCKQIIKSKNGLNNFVSLTQYRNTYGH